MAALVPITPSHFTRTLLALTTDRWAPPSIISARSWAFLWLLSSLLESIKFSGGHMRLSNVIRKLHDGAKYLALVGLCFGALGGAQVSAQVRISESSAGVKSIYFPSNTIGGSGSAYDVPSRIIYSTDGGLPKGTALIPLKNPSGNPLAVTAASRIPAAAVGSALGKFASKVIAPLSVGIALYDLGNELGYLFDNSTGQLVVNKSDPTVCTSAPCYGYRPSNSYFGTTIYPSPLAVCNVVGPGLGLGPNTTTESCDLNSSTGYVNAVFYSPSYGYYNAGTVGTRVSVDPSPVALTPSSLQEFQNSVSAKTNWPVGSNISRALQQAQDDYDIFVEFNPPTLTGPASTPGKTSTSTSSTGSTTTSTTTHNHTYEGSNVTTSNVTVNQTTNIAGDTTTTTTTETPVKEEDPAVDQCEKYPDSVGCQKTDIPTDEVPKTTKTITWAEENLGLGNGACPAPYTFNTSNGNYSLDLTQYCDVLSTYVRPVVLAMALLAAFFIVAPVRTDV